MPFHTGSSSLHLCCLWDLKRESFRGGRLSFKARGDSLKTMAPLLLKHLASSLARQMTHVTFFRSFSFAASRCLSRPPTLSPAQLPPCGPPAQPSLLGRCQHLLLIQQTAGMKTKSALKRRCKDCFFVRRRGRLFVYCKTNPRHKQRQG
ncbi:hypothetical protein OJAV_G00106020 [Oryzias javanicus]|uniref:Ribosomal protein n=1 Tax=Oryzias javanicus TaxID=123683 RepID=A0A3S2U9Y7_ORYJA|nr:hypothetical protein OJAV_G00106020 [Oryzias javanicus]